MERKEKRYLPRQTRVDGSLLEPDFEESLPIPTISNEETIPPVRSAVKSGCGQCG